MQVLSQHFSTQKIYFFYSKNHVFSLVQQIKPSFFQTYVTSRGKIIFKRGGEGGGMSF